MSDESILALWLVAMIAIACFVVDWLDP